MADLMIADKLLSAKEITGDDNAQSPLNFPLEKIMGLLSARLFNDSKHFPRDIRFSINGKSSVSGWSIDSAVGEEDCYEELFEANIERYVTQDCMTAYDHIRKRFAKTIGTEIIYFPIHSQWLMSETSCARNSIEAMERFNLEVPDVIQHICVNETHLLDSKSKEYIKDFDKQLSRAFPQLNALIQIQFSNDPEQEVSDVTLWTYRSKALGDFLTGDFDGEDAERLRNAVNSLDFLVQSVSDGYWWAYEPVGYDHSSMEDNMPLTTISSHHLANMAVIEELLPKFIRKEG